MKITGSGSRLSPIAIDDSEDEVLQELVGEASFELNSLPSTADQRDKVPRNGVSTKPSFEDKTSQKRKRSIHDAQSGPIASTSQQRLDHATHAQPETLSKKAKKRRRKLERLLHEHGGQPPRPPVWLDGAHYLAPELAAPHVWSTVGAGLGKPQSLLDPYSTYNATNYISHEYSAEIPVASSSSSWVASMAMAAETSISDGRGIEPWDSHSYSPNWPDRSQPLGHNIQQFSEPIPVPEPPPAPAPAPPAPAPAPVPKPAVPAAPPPAQIIGMKPDHEPSSKHGVFVIPPNATRRNMEVSSTKGEPYIPNPARTLVMEQLPKSHRSQDWVNAWSKSACGAYPVFQCIDHHGAKALVEFATSELARKAWGSPRLGAALVGLKTHQLKGRPREDLIKVWWYRVDGIGANAGVGEIEEGEIEGDAAEKEIEVPVKKETKKERKARLHRERQAKKLAAAAKLPAPPQRIPQTNAFAPDASGTKEVATPQSFALPPNPFNYSQIEPNTGYPYYSIIPQPLSHPLPQHPPPSAQLAPPPPSRPPLPPQSTLEIKWRPKHELPKKPTRETILNATASIASSKSPSPVETSPNTAQPVPPLSVTSVAPTYEDMDVDDDMDLESPRTAQRASFDLTPAAPMQPQPQAETFQPLPLTTHMSAVAVSNPLLSSTISRTHVDVPSTTVDSIHDTSIPESTSNHPMTPFPVATTSQSRSVSVTPPLEPRAMKNAPKGPSFKIRSLRARQKELEERIAKSKMELGLVTTPVPPTASIESPISMMDSLLPEDGEDKQAMEERLRSLVLRSQKNKMRSSASTTSSTDAHVPSPISSLASPLPGNVVTPITSEASTPTPAIPSVKTPTFSLDDLAVSFITETIETFKATPNPSAPTPGPDPGSITSLQSQHSKVTGVAKQKSELAAQQKRLEAQIAETKVLMAKFEKARTKQEREAILAAMREQSRATSIVKDDNDILITPIIGAATTTPQIAPNPSIQLFSNHAGNALPGHTVKKWPGSHEHDAGVLIVSDDEDESDGDD